MLSDKLKTGRLLSAVKISGLTRGLTSGLKSLMAIAVMGALLQPVLAAPLSDKLLNDMGNSLHRLVPQQPAPSTDSHRSAPSRPDFDFYVLALSWSPSFCADNGKRNDARQQCGSGRPYGFVAHGLWPQYHKGFPESCSHGQANAQVPRDIVSQLSDIMPSAGLMRYQWRKHGTCSGLNQRDYFTTLHDAYNAVVIPPALRNVATPRMVDPKLIEKAFIAANPGLPANAIAVTCKRRRLEEVRICMNSDLKFQACGEVDRNSCRSRSVTLLPNR